MENRLMHLDAFVTASKVAVPTEEGLEWIFA
jgi:hypothetical protein